MRGESWRPRSRAAVVLALLFLLTLPAVTTRLNASDEIEFFSWLHSALFDHDASFENEYRHFYDADPAHNEGFRETFLERTNEAGQRPNFAPIGTALLWLPVLWSRACRRAALWRAG